MRRVWDTAMDLIFSSLPLVFAASLSFTTLSHIARADLKEWEPAFYAFLPMCFFFVGLTTFINRREIRQLRHALAKFRE